MYKILIKNRDSIIVNTRTIKSIQNVELHSNFLINVHMLCQLNVIKVTMQISLLQEDFK